MMRVLWPDKLTCIRLACHNVPLFRCVEVATDANAQR